MSSRRAFSSFNLRTRSWRCVFLRLSSSFCFRSSAMRRSVSGSALPLGRAGSCESPCRRAPFSRYMNLVRSLPQRRAAGTSGPIVRRCDPEGACHRRRGPRGAAPAPRQFNLHVLLDFLLQLGILALQLDMVIPHAKVFRFEVDGGATGPAAAAGGHVATPKWDGLSRLNLRNSAACEAPTDRTVLTATWAAPQKKVGCLNCGARPLVHLDWGFLQQGPPRVLRENGRREAEVRADARIAAPPSALAVLLWLYVSGGRAMRH